MRQFWLAVIVTALFLAPFVHTSRQLNRIGDSITALAELSTPGVSRVIYKKEPGMKTGTLSKILPDGTTITLDYEWDCTVDGWRKILADWKIICENTGN